MIGEGVDIFLYISREREILFFKSMCQLNDSVFNISQAKEVIEVVRHNQEWVSSASSQIGYNGSVSGVKCQYIGNRSVRKDDIAPPPGTYVTNLYFRMLKWGRAL